MSSSELYLRAREKEGRLYSDEIAARLPDIPSDHPLASEWRVRAASMQRLLRHVSHLPLPVRALELGCGNGWLSCRLSALRGLQVWGLDRRSTELTQAARLFNSSNLAFLASDIFQPPFMDSSFDLIVLASVIQYFPDLPALIRRLRLLMAPGAELHILDSPLYSADDLPAARQRTQAYYAKLGVPEMGSCYFHHTFAELMDFSPEWLYRPDSLHTRISRSLGRPSSPFPWLCIR